MYKIKGGGGSKNRSLVQTQISYIFVEHVFKINIKNK